MTEEEISILYKKAVSGKEIDKGILDEVARLLYHHDDSNLDFYKVCQILSLSSDPSNTSVNLIVNLLNLNYDDLVVQGAIQSLCIDWKLTENYIEFLISLLNFSLWDNFDLSISAAAMALAEYFSSNPDDKRILQILDIYDNLEESGITNGDFPENIYFILYSFIHGYDVKSLMDRRTNFSQRREAGLADGIRNSLTRAR